MKPIKTKYTNCIYAENQPEYLPLPVHKTINGIITSCWRLSLLERLCILLKGKIYLRVLTFNKPLQPQKLFLWDKNA